MTKWTRLGSGSFNIAYINEEQTLVFKIQKSQNDFLPITDLPDRSVRLWNEINDDCEPQAYLFTDDGQPPQSGWICPFIKGKNASDSEISKALLDLFNRTGRIVIDAYVKGNFKKDEQGKIVCIDIGMALQLQEKEKEFFDGRSRRRSYTSKTEWLDYKKIYGSFPFRAKLFKSETVYTTKALLFIKGNCPDIFIVDFLKTNKPLIKQLASAYDKSLNSSPSLSDQKFIGNAINDLRHEKPMTLDHLKTSCIVELERYIKSRGSLNDKREFNPSLKTKFFRNQALTAHKVDVANELIKVLGNASTVDDVKEAINKIRINPKHMNQGIITDDFLRTINKCSFITESPELILTAIERPGIGK